MSERECAEDPIAGVARILDTYLIASGAVQLDERQHPDRDLPDGPVVTRLADGHLSVDYPNGRPKWFAITPEAFEQLVDTINEEHK